jgi:hypothetical protein
MSRAAKLYGPALKRELSTAITHSKTITSTYTFAKDADFLSQKQLLDKYSEDEVASIMDKAPSFHHEYRTARGIQWKVFSI